VLPRPALLLLLATALPALLTGCGSVSGSLRTESSLLATAAEPVSGGRAPAAAAPAPLGTAVEVAPHGSAIDAESVHVASLATDVPVVAESPGPASEVAEGETMLDPAALEAARREREARLEREETAAALAAAAQRDPVDALDEVYDPWEPFNERMFNFNYNVDRYVLKPIARAYNVVVPEPIQVMVANAFGNINVVPRVVNNLLQAKWEGAGRELARFLINSTAGVGGLFDPAKDYWHIPASKEDFGQTLGVWGNPPGPYLILPFMEPLTVRDGIGKLVDGFLDPLSYVLPFVWERLVMRIVDTVNDRSLNLDLFQGFEESVIDLYSAVRHGYTQRREQLIRE
jgi:phospholipid-binding lipoprotein MlaA